MNNLLRLKLKGNLTTFSLTQEHPPTISDALCKELGLKPVFSEEISDITDHKEERLFYSIDSLALGNITFGKVGVLSTSMSQFSDAACIKIDGIIGANIMRTCNWKIDYTNSNLILSDKAFSFPNKNANILDFKENITGNPFVNIHLGNDNLWAEWDSGNNGFTSIVDSIIFKNKNHCITQLAKGYGISSQGVLGVELDSNYYASIDTLFINRIPFPDEIATSGTSNLLGQDFMRRFKEIIMNWKDEKKIYLIGKANTYRDNRTTSYGLDPQYVNGKLKVVFLWENSLPAKQGIQVGDTITALNGKDVTNITNDDWCRIKTEIHELNAPISIVIPNRNNGQPMTFKRLPILNTK